MFAIMMLIEDVTIHASRDPNTKLWSGVSSYSHSGLIHHFANVTDAQIGAIQFLALASEHPAIVGEVENKMYQLAEDAVVDWPLECRPFP